MDTNLNQPKRETQGEAWEGLKCETSVLKVENKVVVKV